MQPQGKYYIIVVTLKYHSNVKNQAKPILKYVETWIQRGLKERVAIFFPVLLCLIAMRPGNRQLSTLCGVSLPTDAAVQVPLP